jgi:hypothetical protein
MSIRDLVTRNRSYRRFDESFILTDQTLIELIELASYTASAGNRQPLRYMPVAGAGPCGQVFPCLQWAAYLSGWDGPAEGERPTGYIVILCDCIPGPEIFCDSGIAAQTLLLGAVERGLGGCILASVDRERLRSLSDIENRYSILYVIALGLPAETVVIDQIADGGDIRYRRDSYGIHHVPKLRVDDIVIRRNEL